MAREIKKSKRGGPRKGAGRPKGAPSKKDLVLKAASEAVIKSCGFAMDPVDAMQEVADWAVEQWRIEVDPKMRMAWAELAVDWQSKVAPYKRPRLAAVAMATEENAVELIREVRRVIVDPRNT